MSPTTVSPTVPASRESWRVLFSWNVLMAAAILAAGAVGAWVGPAQALTWAQGLLDPKLSLVLMMALGVALFVVMVAGSWFAGRQDSRIFRQLASPWVPIQVVLMAAWLLPVGEGASPLLRLLSSFLAWGADLVV